MQWDTTNWLFGPSGVKFALAEFTLAPAAVVMNHFETLPVWLSSGMFVTLDPSLNDADIVAPGMVCVRLNCHVCVPPGSGGGPSNFAHFPSSVPWPVKLIASAAAGATPTKIATNASVMTTMTLRATLRGRELIERRMTLLFVAA